MSIGFVDSFFSRKNRIRRICEPTKLKRILLNLQWKIVSRQVRKIRRFRRCCFVSNCSVDRTPTHNCFRAQQSQRLPVVLSASEIRQILLELDGIDLRMTELLYGTGLRILECCWQTQSGQPGPPKITYHMQLNLCHKACQRRRYSGGVRTTLSLADFFHRT